MNVLVMKPFGIFGLSDVKKAFCEPIMFCKKSSLQRALKMKGNKGHVSFLFFHVFMLTSLRFLGSFRD